MVYQNRLKNALGSLPTHFKFKALTESLLKHLEFDPIIISAINDEEKPAIKIFLDVLAKQYSDNLSAVSQRGSINIAKEGKSPTNKPKYGYIINEGRYFRPDGINFYLLKQAFKLALDRTPLDQIADYLNENNYYFNGKKTKMTKQKLSSIFKDSFYAGAYVYGAEVIGNASVDTLFKPMISPLDFFSFKAHLK